MIKKSKVTISVIADVLKVSPITVSRALASQPGVSSELREKIVRKAQELGYKKVKSRETENILVLVRRRFVADNSIFSQMVQELENNIRKMDAAFTLEFIDNEKHENLVCPYNLERNNRFDGVILFGRFNDTYTSFIKQIINNLVVFNGTLGMVDCDYVLFHTNRNGYKAADYLIKHGHKHIGLIGVDDNPNNCQRFIGFCRRLEEEGLEVCRDYVINTKEEILTRIKSLREQKELPTAFVCHTDHCALQLIKILHDLGVSVPTEVSVIGSGNSEVATLAIPSLTTFNLNVEYACEIAVNTVLNRVNRADAPRISIYVDSIMVLRDSVKQLLNVNKAQHKGVGKIESL